MANILVLGGNLEAVDGLIHIKELGHKIILCDGNPNAVGRKYSDHFILASIYDEEKITSIVPDYLLKNHLYVDGVLTIATDASRSVAKIANKLHLNCYSYDTAYLSTHKYEMKRIFRSHGILVPDFKKIKFINELEKTIKDNANKEYVLKPADSRGSRGIVRLNSNSDLQWAYEFSMQYSKERELILEEWINGNQLSTESVIWEGIHCLCGVSDRNYSKLNKTYPFVVEDGGETPSIFSEKLQYKLNEVLTEAAKAIGLEKGILKGDIIFSKGKIYVVEVAVRLSGGYFSTITIPEVYGNDIIKAAVDISLGLRPAINDFSLIAHKYQANRFLFLEKGRVKKINYKIIDKIKKDKNVEKLTLNVKDNDVIKEITDHTRRCGMVLCIGDSRKEVVDKCVSYIEEIERAIEIER